MIKVGITGQAGFIGTHLYNYLGLHDDIQRIEFKDEWFKCRNHLIKFIQTCDVVVHLAAVNRHYNPELINKKNIELVKTLIIAIDESSKKPHVIFSSSTQEELDNPYGRSKKEGREIFIEWAEENDVKFTGMIIPNVFGPFGKPFYNSVISTFCHQLVQNLTPKIEIDAKMKLIYINDLVEIIYKVIKNEYKENCLYVQHLAERKVSELLEKLKVFKVVYYEKGIIPYLTCYFDICLFNTFITYISKSHYPVYRKIHTDSRGQLAEIIKTKIGGQTFFSLTKPGITRGNHFHRRKIERFCVVKGKALIKLRRIGTNAITEYSVNGKEPSFVDIPVFYTHNITNLGDKDMYTLFWTSEFFNIEDPDTYYEEV